MNFLFIFIFFILGSIIGSFLNVVVLRYNTGLSFISGNSKCFSCGSRIEWYDLIPIVSYLFLGGKCRYCQSKISIQYPLVEVVTGIIFVLSFLKFGMVNINLVFSLLIFSLLIAIAVYDFKHKIIPDGLVFSFVGLSLLYLLYNIFVANEAGSFSVLDLISGPVLFLFFFLLWFLSSGRAIGFGDAKLALGVGWFLGLYFGISAIILSFWIGAFFGILILLFQKLKISQGRLTMKSEIPFAPFIILGLFLEFFLSWDLMRVDFLLDIIKNV